MVPDSLKDSNVAKTVSQQVLQWGFQLHTVTHLLLLRSKQKNWCTPSEGMLYRWQSSEGFLLCAKEWKLWQNKALSSVFAVLCKNIFQCVCLRQLKHDSSLRDPVGLLGVRYSQRHPAQLFSESSVGREMGNMSATASVNDHLLIALTGYFIISFYHRKIVLDQSPKILKRVITQHQQPVINNNNWESQAFLAPFSIFHIHTNKFKWNGKHARQV